MLESGASSTCLPARIEKFLKAILPLHHGFQGGETLTLFQIGLLSTIVETHVSLERKTSMLEGGESSTLIACEN
jgi:hypothetical protein